MDKRYTCWLTQIGVEKLTEERDTILNVRLPKLRAGTLTEVMKTEKQRHHLIRRVLYLNRLLNFNGNPATR